MWKHLGPLAFVVVVGCGGDEPFEPGQGGGGSGAGGSGPASSSTATTTTTTGPGGGGGAGGGASCEGTLCDDECVTDFDENPQHCGACGHDCLGGACEDGVCLGFEMFSSDAFFTDFNRFLSCGEGACFIQRSSDRGLLRYPGSPSVLPIKLAELEEGLSVNSGGVHDGRIVVFGTSFGPPANRVVVYDAVTPGEPLADCVVDSWNSYDLDQFTLMNGRLYLINGTNTLVAYDLETCDPVGLGPAAVGQVVGSSDTSVFIAASTSIRRIGGTTLTIESGQNSQIVADARDVFLARSSESTVLRFAGQLGANRPTITEACDSLALDDDFLYAVDEEQGRVVTMRRPLGAAALEPAALFFDVPGSVWRIYADDQSIFVVEIDSAASLSRYHRIAKPLP